MARRIYLSPGFTTVLPWRAGAMEYARNRGWYVEASSWPDRLFKQLARGEISGVIVSDSDELVRDVAAKGYPVVGIDMTLEGTACVVVDDYAIGEAGADHLAECGHQHHAFYGTQFEWSHARFDGFRDALKRRGVGTCLDNRQAKGGKKVWPDWVMALDRPEIGKWIQSLPRPVAVMACDDVMAREVADVAGELRIRIPQDLALIGVNDDLLLCTAGPVPISSVHPDMEGVGIRAAQLLDQLMQDRDAPRVAQKVARLSVVRRQSTSVFAYEDADVAAAMRMMQEMPCAELDIEMLCRRLNVSRRQFERRFRTAVGHSPGDEIRRLRIEKAKLLLRETDMSLAEIAVRCGYEWSTSLIAAFRKVVGCPPSQYRGQAKA